MVGDVHARVERSVRTVHGVEERLDARLRRLRTEAPSRDRPDAGTMEALLAEARAAAARDDGGGGGGGEARERRDELVAVSRAAA